MADETRIKTVPFREPHRHGEDNVNNVVWTVTGTVESVAEIGEILAWFEAALSLSKFPSRICASIPVIFSQPMKPGDKFAHFTISPFLSEEDRQIANPGSASSGNCWEDVLGNTVYVKGYPTARRAEHHTGMEVSLASMMALNKSQRLSRFKGRFCIKGYCSIILPTRQGGDCIYWHLVTDGTGEYIHYTDYRVQRLWNVYPQDLSITDIVNSRHILGWCDNIQNLAGTYELARRLSSLRFLATLPFLHFPPFSSWSAVATMPG